MATLCLACSSSLPPRLPEPELFLTRCCGRPICPSCLTSNPRLARYNPCLLCLGGMGAIDPGKVDGLVRGGQQQAVINVDGAVRDEDVFDREDVQIHGTTAPPDTLLNEPTRHPEHDGTGTPRAAPEEPPDDNHAHPGRYYIQPDDTLLGISLRLGINGRILCKLNDLPPSTLNTTPYLLHTRTFLILPESHSQHATNAPSAEEDAREKRVGAQIALQRITKETDWGIVQAYVALAEDCDSEPDITSLKFEGEKPQSGSGRAPRRRTLEERAVDLYLDDDEWERREGQRVGVNMNMNIRVE
ncbi:hypothetical protein EI94DRAFT_1769325 [Lactarius quietus]|nr:hypothetical protein EI94DRAFT_1769325 [Lactarius quietus]